MRDWIHNRRLRACTLAGIGFVALGTIGGALLADFTVGGMDPVYVAHAEAPPPARASSEWIDAAFKPVQGRKAEFADPWKPQAERTD